MGHDLSHGRDPTDRDAVARWRRRWRRAFGLGDDIRIGVRTGQAVGCLSNPARLTNDRISWQSPGGASFSHFGLCLGQFNKICNLHFGQCGRVALRNIISHGAAGII